MERKTSDPLLADHPAKDYPFLVYYENKQGEILFDSAYKDEDVARHTVHRIHELFGYTSWMEKR